MEIYALFQTDIHKSASSKILFGVFTSFDLANQAAKDNDLYSHNSEVVIESTTLNCFGEI